jgi:hypothetical protein
MNKVSVQSLNECFNVSWQDFLDCEEISEEDVIGNGMSDALRKAISKSRMGIVFSDEHRENISKALKGKKQDPEFAKYRISCIKNKYRPISKTHRAKSYIVIHPNGVEEEVYNIAQFAREHNLNKSSICAVCKGKREHTKGYKFRYL